MEGTVTAFIDTFMPPIIQRFSDFKDNIYSVVAALGTQAMVKQNYSEGPIRLHMLKSMQDQALKDCAVVWLNREGRENLRISIDDIMHVYFEWTDAVSNDLNKETN